MKKIIALVFVALGLLTIQQSRAMYGFPRVVEIPIDRLVANLEKQATTGTNRVRQTYWLARVHSLAYAIQLESMRATTNNFAPRFGFPDSDLGIPREIKPPATEEGRRKAQAHLTNAVHQYEIALKLLRKDSNPERYRWILLPLNLGYAWCLEQSGEKQKAIDAYRDTFEIAWQLEVVGEVTLKEWFAERWQDVKARRNPIHAQRNKTIDARPCFTEESFKCLFRLLDQEADKKEIARLKELETEFKAIPRSFWITPILVPVKSDFSFDELVDPDAQVRFNLDGVYADRRWGWITTNAAWLVYDHTGRGEITSGRQLIGNVTFWIFWENGYQALQALDDDGNGALEGVELSGLSLWHDGNSNGISEPGEVNRVSVWDIEMIEVGSQAHPEGFPWNPEGIKFHDGSARPTYDWIVPSHPEPDEDSKLEIQ